MLYVPSVNALYWISSDS